MQCCNTARAPSTTTFRPIVWRTAAAGEMTRDGMCIIIGGLDLFNLKRQSCYLLKILSNKGLNIWWCRTDVVPNLTFVSIMMWAEKWSYGNKHVCNALRYAPSYDEGCLSLVDTIDHSIVAQVGVQSDKGKGLEQKKNKIWILLIPLSPNSLLKQEKF